LGEGLFSPSDGNMFEIITAAGIENDFASKVLPPLPGGLSWEILMSETSYILQVTSGVVAGLPGDYNGDFAVTAADYTVWRNTLGSDEDFRADGTGPGLDGIPDGFVDVHDYHFWKAHYGDTPLSGSSTRASALAGVPEPSSLAPLAILAPLMPLIPRQRPILS
jgi:hypothetical protein